LFIPESRHSRIYQNLPNERVATPARAGDY
jgi:hypothetical protein